MVKNNYITAGDLTERIKVISFDENGDDVVFAEVWAKVEDKNGLEKLEEQGVISISTVEFTIRYIPGIDIIQEIEHDGLRYNIRNIVRIGRMKFLKLTTQIRE